MRYNYMFCREPSGQWAFWVTERGSSGRDVCIYFEQGAIDLQAAAVIAEEIDETLRKPKKRRFEPCPDAWRGSVANPDAAYREYTETHGPDDLDIYTDVNELSAVYHLTLYAWEPVKWSATFSADRAREMLDTSQPGAVIAVIQDGDTPIIIGTL